VDAVLAATYRRAVVSMLERLTAAQNAHDADTFASCFADDYRSTQPAHPARAFTGNEQVRDNWTALFGGVPDFRARLVDSCVDAEAEWGEVEWSGHHADGSPFLMRGVMVLTLADDRIAAARLYVEPVEGDGEAIGAVVAGLARPSG
jgi:ketosteroid isomerase-like protein